jgi:hypothetical protein
MMNKAVLPAFAIMGLAFVLFLSPVSLAIYTTTITTTILSTSTDIGWLVPDATHFVNSLLILMVPLAAMSMFVILGRAFKLRGDTGVYVALIGITMGSFIADLTAGSAATLAIPFADGVLGGVLFFLWWWNS